jgi:hypothetical protein
MADFFNEDFRDFLKVCNERNVEYILVGGMAVILHGYVRTTGDMDVWVNRTKENYQKIAEAFSDFGMSLFDMTESNFLSDRFDVWSFGVSPVKIELLTTVKGLNFDEAFKNAQFYTEEGISIRFLHLNNLIQSKRASGRHKDLDDIDQLDKK